MEAGDGARTGEKAAHEKRELQEKRKRKSGRHPAGGRQNLLKLVIFLLARKNALISQTYGPFLLSQQRKPNLRK